MSNLPEQFIKETIGEDAWEHYLTKKALKEIKEAIEKQPTQSDGEAYMSYHKALLWFQDKRRKYPDGWKKNLELLLEIGDYNVNHYEDMALPEYKEEPFKLNPERTVRRLKPLNTKLKDTDHFLEITVTPKEGERDEFTSAKDIPPVINHVEWSMHFDSWVSKLSSKDLKDKVLKHFNERTLKSDREDIHSAFGKVLQKRKTRMSQVKLHERFRTMKRNRQICNRFKHSVTLPQKVVTLPYKSKINSGRKGKFSLVTSEQKGLARQTDKKIEEYVKEHERTRGAYIPRDKLAKMKAYSEKLQAQKPK
ncbi:unnamed protein product [Oikopleura dioica]|uniref:Uncharacterized protein n=1 Tax=Oikopleura dioica TaxID=34765 RepID=E4X0Q1_OIKDI|nr:unnamed protein product [Oikopleura dioica]